MSSGTNTSAHRGARIERGTWVVSFVIPIVVLLVLLLAAKPSSADPAASPPPLALSAEEEAESSEEEGSEEEEEEGEESEPGPPGECVLQTAKARAFAYPRQNKMRLVIHYTALASTDVVIEYRTESRKGSLVLGQTLRESSMQGVFRLTESITAGKMKKLQAARRLTVTMHIPVAPDYCEQFHSRHLTIRRAARNQVVWLQSDSIFGTAQ
jgi:hypothetical protein